MTDLAEFLLARIAEDENLATDAARFVGGPFGPYGVGRSAHVVRALWRHADHWTPARVLAECEAKRRIIDAAWLDHERIEGEWGMCRGRKQMIEADDYPDVVRLLAVPYADHPDFREEWRP